MQDKRKAPKPKTVPLFKNFPGTAPDSISPESGAHFQNELDVEAMREWNKEKKD